LGEKMANLIESIRELFERMSYTQIDWRHIDETRARLVKMRFNRALDPTPLNFEPDLDRPNTNLASNATFNVPMRRQQRNAIIHWRCKDMVDVTTVSVSKEKELAETLLSESSHPIMYANEDWYYKSRTSGQYEPIVIPGASYDVDPELSEIKCLPQYEPFVIPGMTFDVDPAHPQDGVHAKIILFPELECCEQVSPFDSVVADHSASA
jgi:hypothetical protein